MSQDLPLCLSNENNRDNNIIMIKGEERDRPKWGVYIFRVGSRSKELLPGLMACALPSIYINTLITPTCLVTL
jgi:hypothetical protein